MGNLFTTGTDALEVPRPEALDESMQTPDDTVGAGGGRLDARHSSCASKAWKLAHTPLQSLNPQLSNGAWASFHSFDTVARRGEECDHITHVP